MSFTKMSELTYKDYNKTRLVVRGDRSKYDRIIRNLGGRWYGKLKEGPGWTISRDKEPELKKLLGIVQEDESLNNMKTSAKSRKNQKKYHRAISEHEESDEEDNNFVDEKEEEDVESSDDESSEEEDEQVIKDKIHKPRKVVVRRKKTSPKYRRRNDDILTYYKSFARSPEQRRYVASDSSSDEDYTSSDDSLDYAQSPRKTKTVEYTELAREVRNVQRRLFEVELRLKKKKKHNN
uniref:Uncharacterized protein n=1 Tax=Iridovirus LCIVAC01 TaxID=2506607 RepID=A0A481YQ31_9VIRU|nr:MAG: hypothetical protein LCIVAC01_00970 [Iridovirus LCIVAC01]